MADSGCPGAGRPPVFFGGLLGLSLALASVGLSAATEVRPVLRSRAADAVPGAWSAAWTRVPAVGVRCPSPASSGPRVAVVRALKVPGGSALLFEWPDASPDLSFEGSMYPRVLRSAAAKVQETVLVRDALTVSLGPARGAGLLSAASRGLTRHGAWIWRSEWQAARDRSASAARQQAARKSYIALYPIQGDGAYPARFVANTNAIVEPPSPCRWLVRPAPDVYTPPVERPMAGEGRWRDGRWRVLFNVPDSHLAPFGRRIALVLAITDGGLGERARDRSVSEPLCLELSGAGMAAGGGAR